MNKNNNELNCNFCHQSIFNYPRHILFECNELETIRKGSNINVKHNLVDSLSCNKNNIWNVIKFLNKVFTSDKRLKYV